MLTLTMTQPDDFHLHLREGKMMQSIVTDTVRQFARAIIMPNLTSPIITTAQAMDYRKSIMQSLPADIDFEPLMTLYLSANTTIEEIARAKQNKHIHAIKYYPCGATTNSEHGIKTIESVYHLLEAMAEQGIPLLVHGELLSPEIDIFDREAAFIDRILLPLTERLPELRIVLEHISTKQAVEFILSATDKIAATVTPQHLLLNRDALFNSGLNPHNYCLPILKSEPHRQALINAATSGNPKFFLGTDSAPHTIAAKETAYSHAGIYSAYHAIELYAEAFEATNRLDKLEAFSSHHGADFYGLPRNQTKITLHKECWRIPKSLAFADSKLVPLRAGENCQWKIADRDSYTPSREFTPVPAMPTNALIAERFRSYYPVVVDVETGGLNIETDALLEIAAATLCINDEGMWSIDDIVSYQVEPFEGTNLDPIALEFTGIDPEHPFRKQIAISEKKALEKIFKLVREKIRAYHCKRAILVGHNPSFDLGFLKAAVKRNGMKRNPFHPFSTFDTATLGGLIYGQTVLSRAVVAAGIDWDAKQAHSANYDVEKTASLFCNIVNRWENFAAK